MGFTYLVTGVNIYPIPEVIQSFVQIPGSCSSQETGCSIGLGIKRKSMRVRVSLFFPITSTGPALHLVAENVITETRQKRQRPVRSRWELLGQTEVSQIRQEEAGLGPVLRVKSIQMTGQESHMRSAARPSTVGRVRRKF